MADSLASLSTAFTYGSLLLALLAIILAVSWGFMVKKSAEEEAKKEAEKHAKEYIQKWLDNTAPIIVRKHVEYLKDTTSEGKAADQLSDQLGNDAG